MSCLWTRVRYSGSNNCLNCLKKSDSRTLSDISPVIFKNCTLFLWNVNEINFCCFKQYKVCCELFCWFFFRTCSKLSLKQTLPYEIPAQQRINDELSLDQIVSQLSSEILEILLGRRHTSSVGIAFCFLHLISLHTTTSVWTKWIALALISHFHYSSGCFTGQTRVNSFSTT